MSNQFQDLLDKERELSKSLSNPDNFESDNFAEIAREYAKLKEIFPLAKKALQLEDEISEAKEILTELSKNSSDNEFYNNIITHNNILLTNIKNTIETSLAEDDSQDLSVPAIVEIRAGTGGEEAALFAADLVRMYLKYCESKNWPIEIISSHQTGNGGFKEFQFMVNHKQAYSALRLESGVHRVQRVPTTESSGRIHTSAASVVILPFFKNPRISVNEHDLKIDTYRSSGPGGQSVNTTDSAVRITHIPTGLVVTCQDQKSQLKNKSKALEILKSKLYQLQQENTANKEDEQRKTAIKGGDRSDKIRTYNYPQSRVTDHRISYSWYNLDNILDGDLDEIISTVNEKL